MHFRGLDLNLIVALDALLTHRNVTRAAQTLHLSQPAMSGSLARLRLHYDDQLLVRCGHEFRLTTLAEELVLPIRQVLLRMDAALDMTLRFDPRTSQRSFSIMASDYVSTVMIAPMLRRVGALAPGLSFTITPFTLLPWQALEHGDIDLLIIADNLVSSSQPYETLFEDEFVCMLWAENPLDESDLTIEHYLSLGHVMCRYGNSEVAYIEEKFFHDAGYTRKVEVVATSFSEVPHYLIGTPRVAITHRKLADAFARTMAVRYVDPPVQMPVVRQAMQWNCHRDRDPSLEWLRLQIRQTIRDF